jgi:hypothetical protein
MATTVSLTKINFMSEDTFNKLSSLDSQQLYAVEASSLITSVMNNAGLKRPTFTVLFENTSGQGAGDITLSQPFTNFPYLMVNVTDDQQTFRKPCIIPSWLLDFSLRELDKPYLFGDSAVYWQISTYADGSSTTLWKVSRENAVFRGVYGFSMDPDKLI